MSDWTPAQLQNEVVEQGRLAAALQRDCVQALSHLGFVLDEMADLEPDMRCRGLDEALAFYNTQCPDAKVVPHEGYTTYLINYGPMDAAVGIPRPTRAFLATLAPEATPADPSQCARNPCVVAGPSLVVQAEQRVNFAAGNAAADDHGCTKESVRAAAAIIASSLPSIAALDRARGAGSVSDAEAAAFRRGVEAMRKAARAEMNRLYFAEAEPTQQAYDRQDAFHCADRAIAAMPPPEDTP
jgi:hypothetical protein